MELPRLLKMQRKVRMWFKARGLESFQDDAAQAYAVSVLEGKSKRQMVDYFCMDFVRKELGDERTIHFKDRGGCELSPTLAAKEAGPNEALEKVLSFALLYGNERDVRMVRRYLAGYSYEDLSREEGIAVSRVAQLFKALRTKGPASQDLGKP